MGAYIKKTIGGVPKGIPLTTDSGQGLPLGAWTSFEDDQPRNGYLKAGTTFNQSDYPALYAMLGTNVVPERFDHSRPSNEEEITIGTSSSNPTTAEYDGIINVNLNSASNGVVYLSSDGGTTYLLVCNITGENIGKAGVITVKKGDKFYTTGYNSAKLCYARWYKHPMFIKAVIGPIEDSAADQVVQNINNSRSYSTEEVNTGKTWIDGKPIYRKVLLTTSTVSMTTIWITVSGWSTKPADFENLTFFNIPITYGNRIDISIPNSSFEFMSLASNLSIPKDAPLVIEYTKTTD